MFSQVITINKRKYATGLFWQPVGAGFSARNYARTLSHDVDKKLTLYAQYRSMIAMGSKGLGHRAYMPIAASAVIDAISEYASFLAVFDTGGGTYYMVAVRNGIVLEDKLFQTEAAAREHYSKMTEIPDWSALIAPAAWAMPRAVERNLGEIMAHAQNTLLRPISRLRARMFSVLLFALFIVGVLYLFRAPITQMLTPRVPMAKIDPELAAEYKRQIEAKNRELDIQFEIEKAPEPEPIVMPYEMLPDRNARASTCFRAMGFLMQPVSGWNQTNVRCDEDNATVTFRRDYGTLLDFYDVAAKIMPGGFVQELSENALRVTAKLPSVSVRASVDERDAETIVRDITSVFQSVSADIDVNIVVDTLTNGVNTVSVNIVEIAAQSKLAPIQFMDAFSNFGGVYMTACEWDAARRIWNYEVIIYAK